MDLSEEQIDEIERVLERLKTVDPAELPEPAADLVAMLNRLLEETEQS